MGEYLSCTFCFTLFRLNYFSRVGGDVNRAGVKWRIKSWPGGPQNWNDRNSTTRNDVLEESVAQREFMKYVKGYTIMPAG